MCSAALVVDQARDYVQAAPNNLREVPALGAWTEFEGLRTTSFCSITNTTTAVRSGQDGTGSGMNKIIHCESLDTQQPCASSAYAEHDHSLAEGPGRVVRRQQPQGLRFGKA